MSWLNQIRNIFKIPSNPSKVIEVKQDKYSDIVPESRGNGIPAIHLYKTGGGKEPEIFDIVLLRPINDNPNSAYSIYRSPERSKAEEKFIVYCDNIPILYSICKDATSVNGLQKICDLINENPSWNLAHIAIQLNFLDILSKPEIISYLSEPDPFTRLYPIHLAAKNANLAAIKSLLKSNINLEVIDQDGNTVHHYGAESNKEIVSLLSTKAPQYLNYRNADGNTPLHVACLADKRDCVKALLLAGADANVSAKPAASSTSSAVNIGKIVKDHDGKLHDQDIKFGGTPLHWSCSKEVINELIQNNCDINAVNFNGRTALHIMILRERLECAIALLCNGCEVDLEDDDGNTPLHVAAQQKNLSLVQSLCVFGADLNKRNKKGETVRHIAASLSPDSNAKKVLYALHAIGAPRCTSQDYEILQNCADGCHSSGMDNGSPPPEPKSYPPRAVMTLYDTLFPTTVAKGGRLLCLDGGGIRGLVLIAILLHLEETANVPIIHCFDWVSGTSTGAILALGLAAGKTLRECLCLYFLLKEKTFIGSRPYASENLENLLKDIFGELKMSDIKHPKLIITGLVACNKPANLHLFRNYTPPCEMVFPDGNADANGFVAVPKPDAQLAWKTARSSGAAPTYFRTFEQFLDGGLIANNPTLDALTEIHEYNLAMKYLGCFEGICKPSVVVSVGTGCIPVTEVKDIDVFRPERIADGMKVVRGIAALSTLLVDQATLADGRVVDRARAWCHSIDVPFFRFSPQMSEEIPMDETDDQKLVNMLWETKAYMIQHHTEVLKLVSLLKN